MLGLSICLGRLLGSSSGLSFFVPAAGRSSYPADKLGSISAKNTLDGPAASGDVLTMLFLSPVGPSANREGRRFVSCSR